jgi:hypothetical protein
MENDIEIKKGYGIMDLIAEAMNETEIKNLVSKGKSEYKHASPKTVRRWDKVAKRRISELNTSDSTIQIDKKTRKEKVR